MTRVAQAVLKDGDEEVDGFVKTRRTRKWPNERPRKNKTPRRFKILQLEEAQAPVLELPVVAAVNPPEEKKGVIEMENNGNTQSKAPFMPRFELCHVCGRNSKSIVAAENGDKKKYLVCKACDDRYKEYVDLTGKQIAEKKNPVIYPDKIAWARAQLDLQVQRLEQELKAIWAEREAKRVRAWAIEQAEADKKDKSLSVELLEATIIGYQNKRINELYFTAKRQNACLQDARKRKLGFEQMLANPAPVLPVPAPTTEISTEPAAGAPVAIATETPAETPPAEPVLAAS